MTEGRWLVRDGDWLPPATVGIAVPNEGTELLSRPWYGGIASSSLGNDCLSPTHCR